MDVRHTKENKDEIFWVFRESGAMVCFKDVSSALIQTVTVDGKTEWNIRVVLRDPLKEVIIGCRNEQQAREDLFDGLLVKYGYNVAKKRNKARTERLAREFDSCESVGHYYTFPVVK